MVLIGGQRHRIVSPHKREDLLVALLPGGIKRSLKQLLRNSLALAIRRHIRSQDPNVIEGVRIAGKGLQALEPDDSLVSSLLSYQKDATIGKILYLPSFVLDCERFIKNRIRTRLNDRIDDGDHLPGVARARFANQQFHLE